MKSFYAFYYFVVQDYVKSVFVDKIQQNIYKRFKKINIVG